MNKKIILVCIITILLLLILTICFYYNSCNYEDLIVDEETWNRIISERTISDTNLITSIKFNEYELLYDYVNCTYYYSLIESLNNKYNPNVRYKTNKDDLKIVLNKKITDESIETNDCINIMLYNDTEFSIYSLKCTTLPLLNITSNDMNQLLDDKDLNKLKENDVDISLYLFDNSKSSVKRITKSDGKIHVRGAITSLFPKKGYKISLEKESIGNHTRKNDLSLLGMRKDDDWILYAAYNDQEKIRNVFATNLWYESSAKSNMFGINNGSEFKFIELFLNNEYWGLYALGYRIDEKQLNINKDTEYMFKKIQFDEAELNVLKQEELKLPNYELINDVEDEEDAWKSLKNYYVSLLESKDANELYSISDMNNLIDYYLFEEVIQANDNPGKMFLKNVFITIKKINNRKVVLYTPWDYDLCMGNIYDGNAINFTLPYSVEIDKIVDFKLNSIGSLQKLNDKKINDLIKNRYKELRNTYWSEEHLEELISKYSKQIYDSGAFNRDKNKWLDGSFNEESEKLTKFREYVFNRLKYTDEFIFGM